MKLLLLQGAQVNQEVCHGRHPLHEASRLGRAAAATLLLEAGAHPDPRSHYGLTPLALAAQGGHHEVVEALLKKGESLAAWTLLTFNFTPNYSAAMELNSISTKMTLTMHLP